MAVSWPTEYYTSDGTFAKKEDIAEPKELTVFVSDADKFNQTFISDKEVWFLDIDLGKSQYITTVAHKWE